MTYEDRRDAGQELAERLRGYKHHAVVYALPRGGVAVGAEVARILDVPLDIIIARKIGHAGDPEYAVGAVTETGPPVWNELEEFSLSPLWKEQALIQERLESKRRRMAYTNGHRHVSPSHRTAILVDDGVATGMTMLAAVRELKKFHPLRIVVGVPCAPAEAVDKLIEEVDEVVVLTNPDTYLGAVAAYYYDFPQLTDEEVTDLLKSLHVSY